MAKYEAGLHKDVTTIFNGVWIPHIDNLQQSVEAAASISASYAYPRPLALEQWTLPRNVSSTSKSMKISSFSDIFRKLPGFSGESRRERKRLASISRHLLINLPS